MFKNTGAQNNGGLSLDSFFFCMTIATAGPVSHLELLG